MKKKSQMEILGLAIVVVIILMATIFVVRFVVLKTPTDYREGFVYSEEANNFVSVFLKTNADGCKQLTMTELLQDCAQSESLCCLNCDDADTSTHVSSCRFVNLTAAEVFENTLKKWSAKYEFLTYRKNDKPFIKLGEQCKGEKRSSRPWPIPIKADTIYVKLDICI